MTIHLQVQWLVVVMATPSITELIRSSFNSGNSSRTTRSKRLYTSYGEREGGGGEGEEGSGGGQH